MFQLFLHTTNDSFELIISSLRRDSVPEPYQQVSLVKVYIKDFVTQCFLAYAEEFLVGIVTPT